jgi:hypothetical protein
MKRSMLMGELIHSAISDKHKGLVITKKNVQFNLHPTLLLGAKITKLN